MCDIYIQADPSLYESRARSIRLHGAVSSIRLENMFWRVLEDIAAHDGVSVNQLITRLYDELLAARGTIGNFASFLRVSCLRYHYRHPALAGMTAVLRRGPVEHLGQVS
jgi:predicted DNA-binding ribbon-helix-helix protein